MVAPDLDGIGVTKPQVESGKKIVSGSRATQLRPVQGGDDSVPAQELASPPVLVIPTTAVGKELQKQTDLSAEIPDLAAHASSASEVPSDAREAVLDANSLATKAVDPFQTPPQNKAALSSNVSAGPEPPSSSPVLAVSPTRSAGPIQTPIRQEFASEPGRPGPAGNNTESRRAKFTLSETDDKLLDAKAAVASEPASVTSPAPATNPNPPPHFATLPSITPTAHPPSDSAAAPSPAVQVAQAVTEPVRVLLGSPSNQANGPQITTIQLDPVELGRVEVRIERSNEGPAKIDLAVQRPETLLRLVHDQVHLQQALDQAGIPQSARIITFSLAPDSGSGTALASFAGGNPSHGNGQRPQQGFANPSTAAADAVDSTTPMPAWSRPGLNITA